MQWSQCGLAGSLGISSSSLCASVEHMDTLSIVLSAEPGGLHLMLVDLKSPLVVGSLVPLVLQFEGAGEVTVQLKVEHAMDAAAH